MNEMTKCPKCGGSGELKEYRHIANGVCFHCHGTGKAPALKGEALLPVLVRHYDFPNAPLFDKLDRFATKAEAWEFIKTYCRSSHRVEVAIDGAVVWTRGEEPQLPD